MANQDMDKGRRVAADTSDRVEVDTYDPHIIPAETAARQEREGNLYKTHPTEDREANALTDQQTDPGSIHTTDGYTVDKEGLINNYAIEPEMYYEVPGDARAHEQELQEQRSAEYQDLSEESQGQLTAESDHRGHGQGLV